MSIIRSSHLIDAIIVSLVNVGQGVDEILGMVALGALARSDLKANSDVDLGIVVKEGYLEHVKNFIVEHLEESVNLSPVLKLDLFNRAMLYLRESPEVMASDANESTLMFKLDLFFVENLDALLNYLKESEIKPQHWEKSILLDKSDTIRSFLTLKSKKIVKKVADVVRYHAFRFVESFEEASRAHFGGDAYRYVNRMMDAFHHLVMLHHVTRGEFTFGSKHQKYVLERLPMHENFEFRSLIPNAELENANTMKIKYYRVFSSILGNIMSRGIFPQSETVKLMNFCELVIKRDFFWNFRDIASINPRKLRKDVLYRSAYLYHPELKDEFLDLLKSHRIRTVIDLRTTKECENNSDYKSFLIGIGMNYVNIPLDPQKYRPGEVELRYIKYDDEKRYRPALYEILPRYLTKELREIFTALVSHEKPLLIHCHAGKDRTGMVLAILLSALGMSEDEVILDYRLATPDIETTLIHTTLAVINEFGDAQEYLMKRVGLSVDHLEKLRQMLLMSDGG